MVLKASTRERILSIAHEMGYLPHGYTRSIRSGRFNCLALLTMVDPLGGSLLGPVLSGVYNAALAAGQHLSIAMLTREQLENADRTPRFLRERMSDGLLVDVPQLPDHLHDMIDQYRVPAVWINNKLAENAVRPDDHGAACTMTERMIRLGHRRIAFVDYSVTAHYSGLDRYSGYVQAMESAGLLPRKIEGRASLPPEERVKLSRAWLTATDRPTAVVAEQPWSAEPILCTALELGLCVPRDLSIATFATRLVENTGYAITTCQIPMYQIGCSAVEMLLKKITDLNSEPPSRLLPFEFLEGETMASPPLPST